MSDLQCNECGAKWLTGFVGTEKGYFLCYSCARKANHPAMPDTPKPAEPQAKEPFYKLEPDLACLGPKPADISKNSPKNDTSKEHNEKSENFHHVDTKPQEPIFVDRLADKNGTEIILPEKLYRQSAYDAVVKERDQARQNVTEVEKFLGEHIRDLTDEFDKLADQWSKTQVENASLRAEIEALRRACANCGSYSQGMDEFLAQADALRDKRNKHTKE